jgi:DNA repair protein RecO (recombination protein O)
MSHYVRTTALSINRYDYSETSQVVKFFSPETGAFNALAKGAKRDKNTIGGPLDILHLYEITFIRKPAECLNILTGAEILNPFIPVRQDIGKFNASSRMLLLVNELLPFHAKNSEVFELCLNTLANICLGSKPAMDLLYFELHLLRLLGHMPRMNSCAACGEPLQAQFARTSFSASSGGILCRTCASGIPEKVEAPTGVFTFFDSMLNNRITKLDRITLAGGLHPETRRILNYYFSYIIEKPVCNYA